LEARAAAEATLEKATRALLAALTPRGHWEGHLSSSALSTATAVVALAVMDRAAHGPLIERGLRWLERSQNADGGWGDTPISKSNISTTALVWAAFGQADADANFPEAINRAKTWLQVTTPASVVSLQERIVQRYGKDRTFSVPILMTLAVSGRLGVKAWEKIPKLPFELAALSHRFWGILRLPVVSYALPALIAIGQVIHHHAPTRNPLTRSLRAITRAKTLRVLETLQPGNGGFLEATPLTSFVTMSLAAMGLRENLVARRGVEFLVASARDDGSWPIDTNLATWVSTLAIHALAPQPGALTPEQRLALREWLLGQQWTREHPYTHAAPGGWAWTDLPGGVPDADDTPGALLALLQLGVLDAATERAGLSGCRWLLDLQNGDGGIPTFCRGWGALPFDRSSPDLTAHTLRAWSAWRVHLPAGERPRIDRAIRAGLGFLARHQRPDGAWIPLWFGNEHEPAEENPIYGTSRVVLALRDLEAAGDTTIRPMLTRATEWLASAQNEDGGWGGAPGIPSTTEETALALEAIAGSAHVAAADRGAEWLAGKVRDGTWTQPSAIGFYFAKLWYYDELYPQIWTVAALGRAVK
jgi:squalene-hopene/tetraprenyl-beta-curcumene cyclase